MLSDISVVTGSARFDVCAPSFAWLTEKQRGPAELEPYILVCSRFSTAHAKGQAEPFLIARDQPPGFDLRTSADAIFESWRHEMHEFAEFIVFIKELAFNFPDYKVIVRPHPSESVNFYEHAFATLPNVIVRRDYSALAWIRSAALVVHSNCTTGIEAVLAGATVMNFKPEMNDRNKCDVKVACEAGVAVGTIPDALQEAQRLLLSDKTTVFWSEDAKAILNNLSTESIPLLTELVFEVLRERNIDSSRIVFPKADRVRSALRPLMRNDRFAPLFDQLRSAVLSRPHDAYIVSKRGRLDAQHVEAVVRGSRERGIGGGRLRHVTDSYAVIEPA
jgi:hypothetical protein